MNDVRPAAGGRLFDVILAQLEDPKPSGVLPVAPEPAPAAAAAPYQLTRPPEPVGEHVIDQQIETDLVTRPKRSPIGRRNGQGHAVARVGRLPGSPHLA